MAVTMNFRWDDAGTIIPVGQAKYIVNEQPIAEYDNWALYTIADDMQAVIDDVINKFNANTILKADTDNTPAALAVGTNTIVGRSSGSISALTASDVRSLLNVASGAEVNLLEEVANVLREKSSGGYNNDFIIGSSQLDDDGDAGHDNRLWFNKDRAAFRAGGVPSTNWNDAHVGDYSFAIGYNTTASGSYSVAVGYETASSDVAAYAEGTSTVASSSSAHAEGYGTTSSGSAAHAEGYDSAASGTAAHAEGYDCSAGSNYSHAGGYDSSSYMVGQCSRANGDFTTRGDAQTSSIVVRKETLGDGLTSLSIDGNVVSSNSNMLLIPANRTWGFVAYITARQIGGTAGTVGDSGIYKVEGGVKRDGANNTTLVGSVTITTLASDQSIWYVSADVNDTYEWLRIRVCGEPNKTIHWVARVDLVEVG